MLVAQNSLGSVCPVPLTVRGIELFSQTRFRGGGLQTVQLLVLRPREQERNGFTGTDFFRKVSKLDTGRRQIEVIEVFFVPP